MLNEEEIELIKKLSSIKDSKLKQMIDEAEKIREELGDNPEIINIEHDIVNVNNQIHRNTMKKGGALIIVLSMSALGILAQCLPADVYKGVMGAISVMVPLLYYRNKFILFNEAEDSVDSQILKLRNQLSILKEQDEIDCEDEISAKTR